jgi:hypothetical protein
MEHPERVVMNMAPTKSRAANCFLLKAFSSLLFYTYSLLEYTAFTTGESIQ